MREGHQSNAGALYAHSFAGRPVHEWEPLAEHLQAVADRAGNFAATFGWAEFARTAGLLHDIGKCSDAFQAYLRTPRTEDGPRMRGPDHSTAGAREASAYYAASPTLKRLLATVIAAHHAGLSDGDDLDRRLGSLLEPYDGWRAASGELPAIASLLGRPMTARTCDTGFAGAFLTRMLFSCLVDADFLETERVVAKAEGRSVARGGHLGIATLASRLREHMAASRPSTPLNALRAEVLEHCVACAPRPRGLFTLTVPTGGGKTLASLSFALEHARHHGMRRVVYVIPFTSIIEQTAEVFRKALGTANDVLEHHASFDWERAAAARRDDAEGADGIAKLNRAAQTWDVPVVVTTAVRFFESLFAARTSRCRKLHNLTDAVIVLDEAQTLPLSLLRPCMAALDQLARNYGATVVLCTATQPALRVCDGFKNGFEMGPERELAPDPRRLYLALQRVRVERLDGKTSDAEIAARFATQPQMLCIVNTRGHARALFDTISSLPGATHLTTLMCPRHRRAVLDGVRLRLAAGAPVRLVATSLIEAGVDVDFPEVWRAVAGLESIAQAAGRCNREGLLTRGRVVVFDPTDAKPLRALEMNWQAARAVLPRHVDPLGLDSVQAYFQELYWQKGDAAVDAKQIMASIAERANTMAFPFRTIAETFRMIEDAAEPVIVPWDDDGRTLLARVAACERATGADLRGLQQYTVGVPRQARADWLLQGVLRPVRRDMGDALLRFEDLSHYDLATGVDLLTPEQRAAEGNVI